MKSNERTFGMQIAKLVVPICRTALVFFWCFLLGNTAQAQGDWTWMKGLNGINQNGIYGVQGIAAPANTPGGRQYAAGCTDASGNLWFFGGQGYPASGSTIGFLNDLWKYNPSTNEWTWVKGDNAISQNGVYGTQGTSAAANKPGGRYYAEAWFDGAGNFWMFGGIGFPESGSTSGYLNDLWKYNPSTNEWTWVKGSKLINQSGTFGAKGTPAVGNTPGGLIATAGGVLPSGNFWLHGGNGYNGSGSSGYMNDLWTFDPISEQWTWVSGSNAPNKNGVYGTQGLPDAGNFPGGRDRTAGWSDASGNIWIFGGVGYPESGLTGNRLNDLWKYDASTNQWVWMKGSKAASQYAVYGTQGTPAPGNTPGAREGTATWYGSTGKLWLHGGAGFTASTTGRLSDLWCYDPSTNEWTWVKGPNTPNPSGAFGTQGTAAPGNYPGGREGAVAWLGASDELWLFGGVGRGVTASNGHLNDLWKYAQPEPPSAEIEASGNGYPIENRSNTPSTDNGTDFGAVPSGSGTATSTFSLGNGSTSVPLELTGAPLVTIAGLNAADFMVTAMPGTPIAPGGSTAFTVEFTPSASGYRWAIVIITHTDLPENPFVFMVSGFGL
ncbi:MAG: kelch repeat-containing protein [Saprospiraceae bacterium]